MLHHGRRPTTTLRALAAAIAAGGLLVAAVAWAQGQPAQPKEPAPALGTATGKIQGRILEKGKDPIPYANVIVLGTKLGTMTDENGNYLLVGVPVGKIQVRAQPLGYGMQTQEVVVDAGATAKLDFNFGQSAVVKQLEEIEVRGERRIDVKTSTTKQSITAEKLKELPVDNLRDAIGTKAGVVAASDGLHFRGGRSGEVKFQFDGVEVSDPLFGRGANIANLAVAGTEILSGGFDAEYGNALSGVVAVSTKEGTDRFGGEVRWDTDRYGDPTKTFDNYDRFTFGFGGPTPLKNLTYFATYEGTFQDTYLKSSMTHPSRTFIDFIQVGNRQNNQINTNFKLAYRVSSRNKVTFETINNRTINTPYFHMWSRQGYVKAVQDTLPPYAIRYGTWSALQLDSTFVPVNLPDHVPTTDERFNGQTFVWTNSISDKSVWTTRIANQNFRTLTSIGQQPPWEYWIQSPYYWAGNTQFGTENNPYFATHGDYPAYVQRDQKAWTAKSDLSTRHWKQHTWKTGFEFKYNQVRNLSLTLPNSETNGLPGGTRSSYVNYNPEGAAYLQDRWEFEGLVLNAGLRYDAFSPGAQVQATGLNGGAPIKRQFSPRLGIAYPISDKDVLSFHYGWTYQTPAHNFIFQNRGVNSSVVTRGNPNLEPETNIAYQAGVQHLFSRDVSGQFSVFFKDIYGLITQRQETDEFGNLVNVYENGDYASSRGFEASLIKSFSHKFSAEINYTYSLANGVASDPNQALQFFNGGRLYLPISERALDWDQRHTLSLQAVVRDPGKWGFRMLWLYGSGFPYTPTYANDRRPDPALENTRRLPSNTRLTIDGDKYYKVWGQNVTLFFDARNVLNAKNISDLSFQLFPNNPNVNLAGDDYLIYYTQTGRAGGAYLQDVNGDNIADWVPLNDPRVFEEGRAVRFGVSVTF